ncbi:alpha/beta hydrolase [Phyllobacterium phragmitis]|uniref:Alpha/beta hydrolase n=1 Tax=Phyllobacterium phragmitis TaxID=2670329 RepID=A0A2S9ITA5_9HYPH|nr:alpha/beta hydrolase [Phyllobacterium phragmitis]PRD43759.1 alpha/beta hydrolase [Phyllobacterium phragmitis]
MLKIKRGFVSTPSGSVHAAISGQGEPVLLLHQTPRSWMEFVDVLPRLGQTYQAIAMDTRGFGDSDPLPSEKTTIEGWAEAALEMMNVLGHGEFCIAGHHTGAVIGLEMAVRAPQRVRKLVVSAMSYVDATRRAEHAGSRVIDEVEPRDDGSHLTELWARRQQHYPKDGGRALLERYIVDAIKAGPLAAEGHRVVNRYRMEDRIGLVRCPTLVIAPSEDIKACSMAPRVAASLQNATLLEIPGGGIPLPDQMPGLFANAVAKFLRADHRRAVF